LQEQDRVFPLSEDESLFLAAHLHVKRGDVVLDVGTGSGIQALCAARRAKHVVATDVNGKALAYARFNAALNGLSAKVEFVRCDCLSEMRAERFDLIVTDPPVIPTPPESHFFTHSDGGPFGTKVSSVVLREAVACLKAGGRLQMLCTALSNGDGTWPLLTDIHESDAFVPRVRELYPRSLALDKLLTRFRGVASYDKWKAALAAQDLRRVHYLYIDVVPRNRVRSHPLPLGQQSTAKNDGSWGGRMRRLFLAYQGQ
jgi:tRNA1(Val) A37 N6-methylase TrmN6